LFGAVESKYFLDKNKYYLLFHEKSNADI
jgi:hypothetical protein